MADSKITALTSISTSTDPANDPLVIVDVSDTSMAATGTTKKVTLNQLLGASGTATLASATITGDLTVDTSTLKVDSANNRVGIGTASPANQLSVRNEGASGIAVIDVRGGSAGAGAVQISGNATTLGTTSFDLLQNSSGAFVNQRDANPLSMFVNGSERYAISSSGVATWSNVGGVAGTAMTLNATGLGVGNSSPAAALDLTNTGVTAFREIRIENSAVRTFLGVEGSSGRFVGSATNNAYFGCSGAFGLEFATNNNVRMVVDSSGNVGIGVTPSAWGGAGVKVLDVGAAGSFAGSAADVGVVGNAYYNGSSWIYKTSFFSGRYAYALGTGQHQWFTAPSGTAGNAITFTQAMTLDASGNLLVGTTAVGMTAGGVRIKNASGTVGEIALSNNSGSADYVARFFWGSTPTLVGNITVASGGTTYNTTSDYRLKKDVHPLVGGLARVSALKPSVYNWKTDGSAGEGFLAHELAEVVPFAVIGEKDAVNEDGSIKPQGVDMSRVVPILVAAIQELAAEVNALKNA